MRRVVWISVIWLSAVCTGAIASAQAQPGSTADHQNLMSAAGRVAEDGTRVPAHTSVITADAIEASTAKDVPELLRAMAGIHVSDITGAGRHYRLDMRGFGESARQSILMLIDGRPANLYDFAGPDWSLIPLERIARIEIVRGGRGNVIYGDQAVAGVVNIVTLAGGPLAGRTAFEYGSYDTKKTSAGFRQAGDRVSYEIATGYVESEGYRGNGDFLARDIGGGLRTGGDSSWRFYITAGYREDETGSPGPLPLSALQAGERTISQFPGDVIELEDLHVQGGLQASILSNDLFNLNASYRDRSARHYQQSQDLLAVNNGWSDTRIDTDGYSLAPQLIFQEDFKGIANRMLMGYDLIQVRRRVAAQESGARFEDGNERQSSAFYAHDELTVGRHWSLSGGYRLERATYEFERGALADKVLDEESWNAAVAYHFGVSARIYGSYTRGFRFPSLDEVYSQRTAVANAALQAQTSDHYEIGIYTQITRQLNLGINVFRITTRDEIAENPADRTFANLNWDSVRQGLDLTLDMKWKGLSLGGGYVYTEARFEDGPYKDKRIPDVPADRAYAHLGYTFASGFFMGVEGIHVGARHLAGDWNNTAARLDDYLVLNAKVRYTYRWISLYAELNNIFNETYSAYGVLNDVSGPGYYPAPEFNFLTGIRIGFGRTI